MNQKHILFPCLGIFQPLFFHLLLTFPPSYLPPTYLLPPISFTSFPTIPSPELKRAPKLEQHRASRRHEIQGLMKVESSTLKERGKEKTRRTLHPKCKNERRKVSSFHFLHFFLFYVCFFFFCFLQLPSPFSSLQHPPQKKVTTTIVAFLFATPPQKKTIAHCHHLLLLKHKDEGNGNKLLPSLLQYHQKKGDGNKLLLPSSSSQTQKRRQR